MHGNSCEWISIKDSSIKTNLNKCAIAKELTQIDKIIYVSHFKAHHLGGFGGALKNIGVGSAAKVGKMDVHHKLNQYIKTDKCTKCGKCLSVCSNSAINVSDKGNYIIDTKKCITCCNCILQCKEDAISTYEEVVLWSVIIIV